MLKEVEPATLATVETDVVYSEIIELTNLPKVPQQEIVLSPPPQFSETQFGTYICMEEAKMRRSSIPAVPKSHFEEEPHASWQEPSFHRYSIVEDAEVIEYKNFMHGKPPQEDTASRIGNTLGYDANIPDDILTLRTRLRIKKRRLPFIAYAFYAAEAVFQEGLTRVTACTYSPGIPVAIVVSGVVDAIVNMLGILSTITRRASLKEALLDITRMGRLTLFFIHIYGLVKVYSILPPEESDVNSAEYCESTLYWLSFAFFHITTLSSVVVFVGMATAVACFYV